MIDDGSTDATIEIMNEIASVNTKVKVYNFKENSGYGAVMRYGLSKCLDDNSTFAVCLHSDGQYPPELIEEFVREMKKKSIDILQGSRHASGTALKGGMPLYKYIAGKTLTFIENSIFNLKMTDYHSGFMFYSKRALQRLDFLNFSSSFDFDLEVIAAANARRLNIAEKPIPTRYAGEKSYLNPFTYGIRILKVLIRYQWGYYTPFKVHN